MGRRELLRIEDEIEVHFKSFDQFFQEYTRNLSKGGIFIKTKKPFPVQTVLEIKLFLPDEKKPVSVVGEVVHIITEETAKKRGWDAGIGVHFVDYDEEAKERIERYVQKKFAENPQIKADRRKHKRTAFKIKVKFPNAKTLLEEFAKDISEGGIFIPTNYLKPVGEIINVTLVHPETGEHLELEGKVIRVVTEEDAKRAGETKKVPGMGIKFVNLTKEQEEAIEKFLAVEYPLESDEE